MTKQEFYSEYQRLHTQWPDKFMTDNPNKLRALYEIVSPLSIGWLRSFVNRAIKMNDPDLDMIKAASGELRAQRELKKTLEKINNDTEFPEGGLENILNDMGVGSLLEAIQKRRSHVQDP